MAAREESKKGPCYLGLGAWKNGGTINRNRDHRRGSRFALGNEKFNLDKVNHGVS